MVSRFLVFVTVLILVFNQVKISYFAILNYYNPRTLFTQSAPAKSWFEQDL